jgi:DNA-binding FadR family transcriptional regulator
MLEAVQRHEALYEAIRAGDPPGATRVSRTNLFEYYAVHVTAADSERLKLLLD